MKTYAIDIVLNGESRKVEVLARETLLDVLRNKLGAIVVKNGCGKGDCGSFLSYDLWITIKSRRVAAGPYHYLVSLVPHQRLYVFSILHVVFALFGDCMGYLEGDT